MKYEKIWGNKFITRHVESIDGMIKILESTLDELKEMRDDGVTIEGRSKKDYACLVTDDPEIAEKYNFEER